MHEFQTIQSDLSQFTYWFVFESIRTISRILSEFWSKKFTAELLSSGASALFFVFAMRRPCLQRRKSVGLCDREVFVAFVKRSGIGHGVRGWGFMFQMGASPGGVAFARVYHVRNEQMTYGQIWTPFSNLDFISRFWEIGSLVLRDFNVVFLNYLFE